MRENIMSAKMNNLFVLCGIIIALISCSGTQVKKENSGLKDTSVVALLPFDNETVDLEGSEKVRNMLHRELVKKGWKLLSLENIDKKLLGIGISDGGQLPAVSLETLKEACSADILIYGVLMEYSMTSIGVLTKREVEVELKMVDAASGNTLWQETGACINSEAGVDAVASLGLGLAGKIASSIKDGVKKIIPDKTPGGTQVKKASDLMDEVTNFDLRNETRDAIRQLMKSLDSKKIVVQ